MKEQLDEVLDLAQARAIKTKRHRRYLIAQRNEEIRRLRGQGVKLREIADRFGISAQRVQQICGIELERLAVAASLP
ncbi:MAG: hypothetical protein HYY30_01720 [Chloroflexi bacterium]|nr:hypothetical protein [Chloroflexota bacterium]